MQRLPYHDDRNDLRQGLLDASRDYFPATGAAGANADPALRMACVLGSGYAYNLAAAVEWVARNVSEDAADELAAWLSNSLTNGDEDGLNEDIEQTESAS
ncbi:hypothetical protein [Streptomyces sp. NRRL S-813]|uniref:hypothetical protein n=1 Tax=Streptomyces sp. NRRL S-813 TaxID=1463919 RepID=UPI0004BF53AF|nr:hypothetical protein [Streptomyces sp. NRRL S-813]